MDETLYAADRDRAAIVAGVTRRQLDYWTSTGLIHPAVTRRLTPKRPIRLFSFTDLMSVMVAAELRRRRISLQHIRAIVSHLSSLGYPEPLRQLTFATQGHRVYFQHPDGGWEGDQRPGQGVMAQVIDLEPLRLRIRQEGQRPSSTLGHFERRRGTLGSKPVIAGTRVPVSTVRRLLEEGHEPAEVIDAYPILGTEDIDAVAATMSAWHVRFFCDHDVAAQVPQRLRKLGHEAWTAAEAGLNLATDDTLTVYAADKDAVLLTHDREFSQRRRRNVVGRHIQLRCDELAAADLLEAHLDEVVRQCSAFTDVFIAISQEGMEISHGWT